MSDESIVLVRLLSKITLVVIYQNHMMRYRRRIMKIYFYKM